MHFAGPGLSSKVVGAALKQALQLQATNLGALFQLAFYGVLKGVGGGLCTEVDADCAVTGGQAFHHTGGHHCFADTDTPNQ